MPINIFLVYTYINMYHIQVMVILHGSEHFRINIKKILAKHKHVVPIIFQEEKKAYARPFLKKKIMFSIFIR